MVVYNYSGREINAKIVYYGPALSGKTTNLEWIYSKIPTEYSGKMVSLRTQADRTIFFDFLPLELGLIDGYKTRFMLYTVPGQVYYNATRKMVLKGVDGLVFVADSEQGRMADNLESFENLKENLYELGLDPATIPLVLQWNKRDLPNCIPSAELEAQINQFASPAFDASALTGEGVYETLHRACRMIYTKLTLGDHASAAEMGNDAASSLFGDAIAKRLQEVDIPVPTPERVAVASPVAPDPESDVGPVLDHILGNPAAAAPAQPTGGVPPVAEPIAPMVRETVGAPPAADAPGGIQPSAPAFGLNQPSAATQPGSAPAAPVAAPGDPFSNPSAVSGNDTQLQGNLTQFNPDSEPVVSNLVDQVLGRFDDGPEPVEPVAPGAGSLIEHDVDPFEAMASHAGPEDQVAPDASVAEDEELQIISDPRRLSTDRSDHASGFAGLASNAKVIEVPIAIDADTFDEGKPIRVVLNIQLKR